MSREALAVAHATGKHRDIVIAAGMVSPVGILILRWLDNDDQEALRGAKGLLVKKLVGSSLVSSNRALAALQRALNHLKYQRCEVCGGAGNSVQANGVVMPCANRDCHEGLIARLPGEDSVQHHALAIIRREIGASLAGLRDKV